MATLNFAPDFFRGYLNLAIAYYSLDETGECIAAAKRALELSPDDEKGLLILAASYRKLQAYPQAVPVFEKIVELYPEKDEAYIALAEIFRDLKDTQEAIKWLSRYPESGKNEQHVFLLLADMYEADSKAEKALYYLQRSFQKDPGNKWTLYRMVSLHEKNGNNVVALEEARKGLILFPDFAELALLAGNLAFKQHRFTEAQFFYTIAKKQGNASAVVGLENVRLMINASENTATQKGNEELIMKN